MDTATTLRTLGALGLVLLLAGAAAAQGSASEKMQAHERYFWVDTATVVSTDPAKGLLTVDDRDGRAVYRIAGSTLIRKESGSVPLSALSKGDRVTLSAHRGLGEEEDPLVADTVTVVIVDPDSGEPVRRTP